MTSSLNKKRGKIEGGMENYEIMKNLSKHPLKCIINYRVFCFVNIIEKNNLSRVHIKYHFVVRLILFIYLLFRARTPQSL